MDGAPSGGEAQRRRRSFTPQTFLMPRLHFRAFILAGFPPLPIRRLWKFPSVALSNGWKADLEGWSRRRERVDQGGT